MAVLVEAISVLVRMDSVREKVTGGEARFRSLIPNATYCDDGELARVGFLGPDETEAFVEKLKGAGLKFVEDDRCVDIAVCDQQRGPTAPCDWLEFGHFPIEDGRVGAAWLFDGPRRAHGLHMPAGGLKLATPAKWQFKDSISDKFHFLPSDAAKH